MKDMKKATVIDLTVCGENHLFSISDPWEMAHRIRAGAVTEDHQDCPDLLEFYRFLAQCRANLRRVYRRDVTLFVSFRRIN